MADITNNRYCLEDITQGALPCKNPTITWEAAEGITITCLDNECIEIEIIDGFDTHCVTVTIDCEDDCPTCDSVTRTICFCENSDDCGDCEFCNQDGVCNSFCADGQICEDDTCVGCTDDSQCECDQICQNGSCTCPADKPLVRDDGCCVECKSTTDCPPCFVCSNGDCVPKDCGAFVCDPQTGNCEECFTNEHCTEPNQCCVGGDCECCPGYFLNPQTGNCEELPDCYTNEDCPDCFDCVAGDCTERVCPGTRVCVDDECVPGCTNPEDCPDGYGCLDGGCVPCDELSCAGSLTQCARAKGCECDNGDCVPVDCEGDACVEWVATPAQFIPGDSSGDPGLPAIIFSTAFNDLGIVSITSSEGAFRDYEITVATSAGATGQWQVNGGYTTTGSQITFTLSDPGPVQWNNVGFEVTFVESGGTGRTASIVIYNQNYYDVNPASPDESLFENLGTDPANWIVDVDSEGVSPGTSNGMTIPGSLQLCACNVNSTITGYTWNTTEGNLTVTVFPQAGKQCAPASIQGCGTGNGTVTINCGGYNSTIAIPELPYDYSASNCCDPLTDPDCGGGGEGDSCNDYQIVTSSIALIPDYYTTGNDGVFKAVLQEVNGLIEPADFFRNKREICWSTTGDMSLFTSDASFTPGLSPFAFQRVTFGGGAGCVRAGYSCDITFPGCKKLQAEACLDGCPAFSVFLTPSNPGPGETLVASTSFGGSSLSYEWYTNDLTFTLPVGNTLTIPSPNLAMDTVTVTARVNVNGVQCVDTFSIDIDRSSIPNVDGPTYDCEGGLNFNDSGGVVYRNAGNVGLSQGQKLPEDLSYKIIADLGVTTQEYFLDIPPCYDCADCNTPAINGVYDSVAECDQECGNCEETFEAVFGFACEDNAAKVTITINQGTGPFNYSITNGAFFTTGSFSGTATTITGIPQGDIIVNVAEASGDGCDASDSRTVSNCISCVQNDGTVLINVLDDTDLCSGNLTVVFSSSTPNPFPTTVDIIAQGDTLPQATKVVNGTTAEFSGLSLLSGNYNVRVTDANGCSVVQSFVVDCQPGDCQVYGVQFTQLTVTDLGGDNVVNVAWISNGGLPLGAQLQVQKLENIAACNGTGTYTNVGAPIDIGNSSGSTEGVTDPNGSGIIACYRAVITFLAGATTCESVLTVAYEPGFTPPTNPCAICTAMPGSPCSDITWADDELTISWCFSYPPNSFVITVSDPEGLTTFANGTTQKTIVSSNNSSTGTLVLDAPATSTGRDINVDFETGDSNCDFDCDVTVAACVCDITNLVVTPIEANGFLQLEFDTTCTSGTVLVTATGDITDSIVLETTDGIGIGANTTSVNYIWDVSGSYPPAGGSVTVTIEDNILTSGCTDNDVAVLPATCACSLSASGYTYDIDTLELDFELTVADCGTTDVNFFLSDSAGAFVLSPVNPVAVTAGTSNSLTLTLDRPAESDISLLVQDNATPTCSFADTVSVCTIVDPDAIAASDFFAAWEVSFQDNPLDTETIVIDARTYTFQTVLTDVDGNVLIGVDAAETAANLKAAINLEAGAGTTYAASMTLNVDVDAYYYITDTRLYLISEVAGSAGEYTLSETTSDVFIYLRQSGVDTPFYTPNDIGTGSPTTYGDEGALIFDSIGPILLNIDASNNYTFEYPTAGGQATIVGTGSPTAQMKNAAIANGAYETEAAFLGGEIPLVDLGTWVRSVPESVSISQSGGTATVVHTAHGFSTGDKVFIEGVNEFEYAGEKTITVTSVNAYTFSIIISAPATATGTITASHLSNEFVAAACVTIGSLDDYFIAFSCDNVGTLKIGNETIIDLQVANGASSPNQQLPFKFTFIAKVNLAAANHLLSIESINTGSVSAVQYMVIDGVIGDITTAANIAALTLVSDSSVSTGDLDNTISFGMEDGVECSSGSPYFDGCTPKCTDCY